MTEITSAEAIGGEMSADLHPPIIRSNVGTGVPVEGIYTKQIGSGENARNSFIYITIRWSFIIASLTCLAVFVKSVFSPDTGSVELLEVVKGVWSVFIPIITLALGYSFGKGQ